MQPKARKIFWFRILLASSSTNWCCVNVNAAWAAHSNIKSLRRCELSSMEPSLVVAKLTHQQFVQQKSEVVAPELHDSCSLKLTNTDNTITAEVAFKDAENTFVFPHICTPMFMETVSFSPVCQTDSSCSKVNYLESVYKKGSLPKFRGEETTDQTSEYRQVFSLVSNPYEVETLKSPEAEDSKHPVFSSNFSNNEVSKLHSQALSNQILPKPLTPQVDPQPKSNITDNLDSDDLQQQKVQPTDITKTSFTQIDQRLNIPEIDREERLQKLQQRLQKTKLQQTKKPYSDSIIDQELGKLKLREISTPLEQLQPLPIEKQVVPFKPIGSLQGYVSYFQTSNIFSSAVDPIEDGLIFSGLKLASVPLPLGSNTYLNGSIDGNLIRYINQSKFNYNQIRFNLSIYQQLTRRMYGEIGWSNQQLFYTRDNGNYFNAGDRFLNENSLRLSLGRRDPLTQKLMLDSFYEFRLSFTDPHEKRDRVSNFVWLSLNYYLQKYLQVGVDYQFGLSNFTQRDREDQYHRLYSHLNYRVSHNTNINLQAGVTLGGSTDRNIDFDGWFFSINYNLLLGQF